MAYFTINLMVCVLPCWYGFLWVYFVKQYCFEWEKFVKMT
ncbi:putative membrane protein [Moraxella catarrhalis]|nr:putative membrane protein [Moraxella catarrhalis]AZQ90710.1 putative membrane protein [Moraxella catarrhalis]AZQ96278.1 putative membrane protein [Moraxella catarrhalis]RUO14492.1 putative membrane protein [Moraxella catarrhalis]